ncbi:sigma factor-like helix-turn-helix DNA-binding protein [Clostridium tetani]|uniref:sigma-70 region 4 domain-containing protein n=1 Tax=Clostridium tetani TaxID=1513 RepID=UPI0005134DC3|nr:hypothetical protein LA33_04590 [Clostridium tetani ATCC 9441]RXM71345.1 hypothetical protein DP143_11375 [Clostridium tetani]
MYFKRRINYVIKAINTLRSEYRQVITLRYYNNLSFYEIATILNIKERTDNNALQIYKKTF